MAEWSNWSGRIHAAPHTILVPGSEDEIVQAVRGAADRGLSVRVVGAAHSHSPLVPTDGVLLDLAQLTGVVHADGETLTARLRPGTRIADLGAPLRAQGVALLNQGDIDRQAIAGAVATGTHGTGSALRNLSAGLLGARIVQADGSVQECSAQREPELFEAARLNLGGLGILSELTLRVRPAYRLQEKMWLEPVDAVLDRLDELTGATRHFEFFWMPGSDRAACKSLAETDAEPVYPLAEEGKRRGWSDEVLANHRPDKHSEMEYSIPKEHGADCFRALREMLHRDFPDLAWPLEYRTLAADDVWLSTAYRRETVTLSVHQGVDQDDEPLFRACEAIFRGYAGRPHWGKVHFQSADDLAGLYPRWADWWRVRDHWDPECRFLNPHLQALRPGARG
ncbi:MAG TPA: FAD-binding protein [Myxococcales bacterium]|nr:FAD-binding protein [Myxococcales bacterium]